MIDPKQTSPLELATRAYRWVETHIFRIIGLSLVGLIVAGIGIERGWFSAPSIPASVWVILGGGVAGIALGAYPRWKVITGIWDDATVRLVELDPRSGDLTVWTLSEERYTQLNVIDHKGNTHDPSTYLNDIRLGSGELAYEVDGYEPESNVAVASWMAGVRNRELRRYERAIDYVKRELSVEADKTLDQLINSGDVLRQQGKAVGMYLIQSVEGVQTPDSGNMRLHEEMFSALDDADVTDELISDNAGRDPEAAIREFVEDSDGPGLTDGEPVEDEPDVEAEAGVKPASDREDLALKVTRNGDGGGSS